MEEQEGSIFGSIASLSGSFATYGILNNAFENSVRNDLATQSYDNIISATKTGVLKNNNIFLGTQLGGLGEKIANSTLGKLLNKNFNVLSKDNPVVAKDILEGGLGYQDQLDAKIGNFFKSNFTEGELAAFENVPVDKQSQQNLVQKIAAKLRKGENVELARELGGGFIYKNQGKNTSINAFRAAQVIVKGGKFADVRNKSAAKMKGYASNIPVSKTAKEIAGVQTGGILKHITRPINLAAIGIGIASAAAASGQSDSIQNYANYYKNKLSGSNNANNTAGAMELSSKHSYLSMSNDEDYQFILNNRNTATDVLNSYDTYSYSNRDNRTII